MGFCRACYCSSFLLNSCRYVLSVMSYFCALKAYAESNVLLEPGINQSGFSQSCIRLC